MPAPFIKKFKQENLCYIYDVNTNQIIEVEERIYDLIDVYPEGLENNLATLPVSLTNRYSNSQIQDTCAEIAAAREKQGLFSDFRPTKVLLGLDTAEQLREFHDQNMQQLLLELSTGCNLFCAYCPTAGQHVKAPSPKHDMSKEICLRAVDFFYDNSRNTKTPYISYYGGEPLLHFDKIKETVAHVKQKADGAKYGFNLTTNGTLLTDEMMDFFILHDFLINVSYDGPQQVHDRYRRTRDGGGSFQAIKKNLESLKDRAPDYFSNKVAISCVLAPPFDQIDETLAFFATEPLFAELRVKGKIKANVVNTDDTTFLEDLDLIESVKQYPLVSENFTRRFKEAILAQDLSFLTLERRMMETCLYNIARRPIKKLYEYIPPFGACHLGLKRLFVKTSGDFFVCERSGNDYKIGHIDTGLDYERIAGYYRQLEEVVEGCKECWAVSHCERCWVQLGNLDELSPSKKEAFCARKKKEIEKAFKIYAELLQTDPDCLKVLTLAR